MSEGAATQGNQNVVIGVLAAANRVGTWRSDPVVPATLILFTCFVDNDIVERVCVHVLLVHGDQLRSCKTAPMPLFDKRRRSHS